MPRLGIALLAAAVLLAGCIHGTLNVGEEQQPIAGPKVIATFTADTQWSPNETATLTVTWIGGNPPFTVSANMGGGTTQDIPAGTPATSPFSSQFTLIDGTWTYTVTVTDAIGVTGTASRTYSVSGETWEFVWIDDVTFTDGVLTIDVHPEPDDVRPYVEVTVPDGLAVDSTYKQAEWTWFTRRVVFYWTATNVVAGGSGETTITAWTDTGGSDTATQLIEIPPLAIPTDTLCAVASESQTAVGGEVTVVVACGDFPPDRPFHYMNGVAVTVEEGASYVDGTLNVGAIGGEWKDSDGLWAAMIPTPGSYLLPDDFMIVETPVDGSPGMVFIGFNVTPIGGGEVTTGGPLFNFGMTFTSAGAYNLGFIEFEDVKRTYYSDSTSAEFNWTDITNAGVPNTIDVT